jgi:uncharacterized protein YecE (DUF72 family)
LADFRIAATQYDGSMTELSLGTGGFSNEDWVGIFYPPNLKKNQWLGFYAQRFNAVEVNSTFYAVPAQKTFSSMLERSEGRLTFAVKLHRSFTHDVGTAAAADARAAERFQFTIAPVQDAGKLGPLLAQFPFSFKNTGDSRAHLAALAEWFAGFDVAVEFRHHSWDRGPVYQFLEDLGLHAVSVDLPRLEGLPAPTLRGNRFVYLRLHGRNTIHWWDGKDAAERHDYLYTSDELAPWVNAIQKSRLAQAFVFFQNTTRGQGLENARQFQALW